MNMRWVRIAIAAAGLLAVAAPPGEAGPTLAAGGVTAIDARILPASAVGAPAPAGRSGPRDIGSSPESPGATMAVLYCNTNMSGYYYAPGPGYELLDFGTSAGGTVTQFTFAYATTQQVPGNIALRFYTGTDDTTRGAMFTNLLVALPNGSPDGAWYAWFATVNLAPAAQFSLPAGKFGYSFETFTASTGLMLASGGAGNLNCFWRNTDLVWFGGTPHAGFYMQILGLPTLYTLTVQSEHGGAWPGTLTTNSGTVLNQAVTNSPVTAGNGTQFVCGAGQVAGNDYTPVSPTNVTLTLTNNAALTWLWRTNYYLALSVAGSGSLNRASAWLAAGSQAVVMATAAAQWKFAGWSGDTQGDTNNPVMNLAMNRARAVTAHFAPLLPPAITRHPRSVTNAVGASAAFTVAAGGTLPLHYRWQKAGVDIPGAHGTSHTIPSVAPADAGAYRCVVSNLAGAVTSRTATLTVLLPTRGLPGSDYDGDGKADPAACNALNGTWSVLLSGSGYARLDIPGLLGGPGWLPAPADYDGDGLGDPAVYQETTGNWKVMQSGSGYALLARSAFLGTAGWAAASADYDGDGKGDYGAHQETTGSWRLKLSSGGFAPLSLPGFLGGAGKSPAPADYDGDRLADPAVYTRADGTWQILLSSGGYVPLTLPRFLGGPGWLPVPGDYDGDRKADPAVRQDGGHLWRILLSGGGYALVEAPLGL